MLKLKLQYLGHLMWRAQLFGKDPDVGKHWKQEEKRMTEDEMVGWHHPFNSHELEQTRGDGKGHASIVWCCPWGHKESDTDEWLNNNKNLTSSMDRVKDQYAFCSWYDTYLGKISISNIFFKKYLVDKALHFCLLQRAVISSLTSYTTEL